MGQNNDTHSFEKSFRCNLHFNVWFRSRLVVVRIGDFVNCDDVSTEG